MSGSFFSPAAPVELGPSIVPPPQAQRVGIRTLRPGYRIVAGHVFYSAAWLDETAGGFSEPLATPVDVPEAFAPYDAARR
jgi:hypothetical protein